MEISNGNERITVRPFNMHATRSILEILNNDNRVRSAIEKLTRCMRFSEMTVKCPEMEDDESWKTTCPLAFKWHLGFGFMFYTDQKHVIKNVTVTHGEDGKVAVNEEIEREIIIKVPCALHYVERARLYDVNYNTTVVPVTEDASSVDTDIKVFVWNSPQWDTMLYDSRLSALVNPYNFIKSQTLLYKKVSVDDAFNVPFIQRMKDESDKSTKNGAGLDPLDDPGIMQIGLSKDGELFDLPQKDRETKSEAKKILKNGIGVNQHFENLMKTEMIPDRVTSVFTLPTNFVPAQVTATSFRGKLNEMKEEWCEHIVCAIDVDIGFILPSIGIKGSKESIGPTQIARLEATAKHMVNEVITPMIVALYCEQYPWIEAKQVAVKLPVSYGLVLLEDAPPAKKKPKVATAKPE
jgi:hypothetical protein